MNDPKTETIAALVHGTYHLVEPDDDPEALLVGFHGYGETAEEHLKTLRRISGAERWLLCAVQGLHPFYKKNGEEVAASWMTRFDRENAIADNVRYVASVVELLKRRHPTVERVAWVGFSQGVAMAYRAAAFSGHTSHALVALAGDVPPDVAGEPQLPAFPPVLIGRGEDEEWYTEEQMSDDQSTLRDFGISLRTATFAGGHEWTVEFLDHVATFLLSHLEPEE